MKEEKVISKEKSEKSMQLKRMTSKLTIPAVLLVFWIVLSFTAKNFLTYTNFCNLLRQSAIYGIVATGVTFCVVSGNMDLSVGNMVGLSSMVLALLSKAGVPIPICLLATLVLGAIVGACNGIIVTYGHVPSFISTLGMSSVLSGVVYIISGAKIISGIPDVLTKFSSKSFLGIPVYFLICLVVLAIAYIVMSRTPFGRKLYAVGSNRETARLSGININAMVLKVYIINSCIACLGGWLLCCRLASGQPSAGSEYNLECVTAVVLGGATLGGGEGTVLGTLFGVLIIVTIRNGGNLLNINSFWLEVATGILTIVAVLFDQLRRNR